MLDLGPLAAARALRREHLPDRLVGQTSHPVHLWPLGWPTFGGCVRAEAVLREALGDDHTLYALDQVLAAIWLVGLVGLSPDLDARLAAVGPVASTCARAVQGTAWDTVYSYTERVLTELDHVGLVRGALAVAQVEWAVGLGQRDRRKRRLLGHARHQIMPVVAAFGTPGVRLAGKLGEALLVLAKAHPVE